MKLKQKSNDRYTNLICNWTQEASRGDESYKTIGKRTIENSDSFFPKEYSSFFLS